MSPFPYFEILKISYDLARKHLWLWIFGLFLGGASTFNLALASLNIVFNQANLRQGEKFPKIYEWILGFGLKETQLFSLITVLLVVFLFLLMVVAALSFGSVISAAALLTSPEAKDNRVNFRQTLGSARRFFWRILGLQISVTSAFAALALVLGLPIVFLFTSGAAGRGSALLLFALLIFIPASLVFGFLHLFGPILIVLYDRKIQEGISLSFHLVRQKFKESVVLAAFLLGLSLMFSLVVIFCLVLLGIPFGILLWFLYQLQFTLAVQIVSLGGAVLGLALLTFLNAGFAVFQSISWVLAVQEMVRTQKAEKPEKALAVGPA